MGKEYIIYVGNKFSLEWYFTENKKIPALIYFNDLDRTERIEIFELFKLMADIGKILNTTKFRYEDDEDCYE